MNEGRKINTKIIMTATESRGTRNTGREHVGGRGGAVNTRVLAFWRYCTRRDGGKGTVKGKRTATSISQGDRRLVRLRDTPDDGVCTGGRSLNALIDG